MITNIANMKQMVCGCDAASALTSSMHKCWTLIDKYKENVVCDHYIRSCY